MRFTRRFELAGNSLDLGPAGAVLFFAAGRRDLVHWSDNWGPRVNRGQSCIAEFWRRCLKVLVRLHSLVSGEHLAGNSDRRQKTAAQLVSDVRAMAAMAVWWHTDQACFLLLSDADKSKAPASISVERQAGRADAKAPATSGAGQRSKHAPEFYSRVPAPRARGQGPHLVALRRARSVQRLRGRRHIHELRLGSVRRVALQHIAVRLCPRCSASQRCCSGLRHPLHSNPPNE